MFIEVKGDAIQIFLKSQANENFRIAFGHGCNCANTMGAGIAKFVKKSIPESWRLDSHQYKLTGKSSLDSSIAKYGKLITAKHNLLGKTFYASLSSEGQEFKTVLNLYSQLDYWKNGATLESIESCLNDLLESNYFADLYIFPLIGCGLGGLSWSEIKPLFQEFDKKVNEKYGSHVVMVHFSDSDSSYSKNLKVVDAISPDFFK